MHSLIPHRVQEVPPPGGFDKILYKRHLPKRGPPGWVLFGGLFGVMSVGWYLHQINVRIHQYHMCILTAMTASWSEKSCSCGCTFSPSSRPNGTWII